jgi:hypothetical protein
MRSKYLSQLQRLGQHGFNDYKTVAEIRKAISDIFQRDQEETLEKYAIKANQRKAREQLNAN